MVKEYIEREALLSELQEELEYDLKIYTSEQNKYIDYGLKIAIKDVKYQPTTDVVEVVRCKNCKYFGKDMGYGKHDCKKYEMPYCLEDDFCSYGERKEQEDEN